jgi:hypothetical protein
MTRGGHVLMAVVSVGIAAFAILTYKEGGKFVGGGLVAIGLVNVIFKNRIGKSVHDNAKIFSCNLFSVWRDLGVKGAQDLYLRIGIVMIVVGAVDWITFLLRLAPHD